MKEIIIDILNKYLNLFPEEKRKLKLERCINEFKDEQIIDWNNFKGHIVASGFDTYIINYNERLNLLGHYYFDFRYLFVVDKISNLKID